MMNSEFSLPAHPHAFISTNFAGAYYDGDVLISLRYLYDQGQDLIEVPNAIVTDDQSSEMKE